MTRLALAALVLLAGAVVAAPAAGAAARAPCTRSAARQAIARQHLGDPQDNPDPVAQMFDGAATGRHRAMGCSRCGCRAASYGWVVYRSVGGRWERVLFPQRRRFPDQVRTPHP